MEGRTYVEDETGNGGWEESDGREDGFEVHVVLEGEGAEKHCCRRRRREWTIDGRRHGYVRERTREINAL